MHLDCVSSSFKKFPRIRLCICPVKSGKILSEYAANSSTSLWWCPCCGPSCGLPISDINRSIHTLQRLCGEFSHSVTQFLLYIWCTTISDLPFCDSDADSSFSSGTSVSPVPTVSGLCYLRYQFQWHCMPLGNLQYRETLCEHPELPKSCISAMRSYFPQTSWYCRPGLHRCLCTNLAYVPRLRLVSIGSLVRMFVCFCLDPLFFFFGTIPGPLRLWLVACDCDPRLCWVLTLTAKPKWKGRRENGARGLWIVPREKKKNANTSEWSIPYRVRWKTKEEEKQESRKDSLPRTQHREKKGNDRRVFFYALTKVCESQHHMVACIEILSASPFYRKIVPSSGQIPGSRYKLWPDVCLRGCKHQHPGELSPWNFIPSILLLRFVFHSILSFMVCRVPGPRNGRHREYACKHTLPFYAQWFERR